MTTPRNETVRVSTALLLISSPATGKNGKREFKTTRAELVARCMDDAILRARKLWPMAFIAPIAMKARIVSIQDFKELKRIHGDCSIPDDVPFTAPEKVMHQLGLFR